MARKSRKSYILQQESGKVKYTVGAYVRISKEDGEANSSVENQIKIIEQYLSDKADMKLHGFYIDNGVSSFAVRKEFNVMIADAKSGVINCVIVKDSSRFGRNYLENGEYIEHIFPKLGTRFISINDDFDSDVGYNTSDTMMMLFKNVINMNYSGDISNKVKSVVRNKMKLGEYIPSKFPFGYKKEYKNGKTVCVIDEQAAEVVKFVFQLCRDGTGGFRIAGMLNDNNIFTDCGVKEWNRYKVEQILKNPFYIGDYICNKANRVLFQKKTRKLPSEEWITIKNHHEAIISEELFYEVQEKLKRNNSFKCDNRKQNYEYYHNDLYCGDCGRKMKRRVWNGNTYFVCPKYDYAKGLCSLKSIRDDRLKERIFKIIKEHISELIFQNNRNSNQIKQTEIHNYVNSISENVLKKKKAMQMHQQNILEVIYAKGSRYSNNDANLIKTIYDAKIEELLLFQNKLKNCMSKNNEVCVQYTDLNTLNEEIYSYYVKRVRVYDSGISIDFKI